MTGSTSARVATVLAAVSTLAVLAVTGVAVTAYTHRDGASVADGPSSTSASPSPTESPSSTAPPVSEREHVFDDGQFVVGDRGDNAMFEVPSSADDWTTQSSDTVLYYLGKDGKAAVGVAGPAVFRDGYCKTADTASNRGFVGFTRSATGLAARAANEQLSAEWVAAISLNEDLKTSSPHTPVVTEEITLDDGSTAVRSTSRITVTDRTPCDAPAVDFALVSLDTGDAVANLVMVRDAEAPDVLDDELAGQILGTLHRVLG